MSRGVGGSRWTLFTHPVGRGRVRVLEKSTKEKKKEKKKRKKRGLSNDRNRTERERRNEIGGWHPSSVQFWRAGNSILKQDSGDGINLPPRSFVLSFFILTFPPSHSPLRPLPPDTSPILVRLSTLFVSRTSPSFCPGGPRSVPLKDSIWFTHREEPSDTPCRHWSAASPLGWTCPGCSAIRNVKRVYACSVGGFFGDL